MAGRGRYVTTFGGVRVWRGLAEDEPIGPLTRIWRRFKSDCRDLWTLIMRGQPSDIDPLLPFQVMAEMAKIPDEEDLDAWEAVMFAKSGAWWFDPTRYDGTPLAWAAKPVDERPQTLGWNVPPLVEDYVHEVNRRGYSLERLRAIEEQWRLDNCYSLYPCAAQAAYQQAPHAQAQMNALQQQSYQAALQNQTGGGLSSGSIFGASTLLNIL